MFACTLTWPPPDTLALGPTPAFVALFSFRTRIDAPTPTAPAAAAPATPTTLRLSVAQTWTWPPATTAPSTVAVVPAVGTVEIASDATLPPTPAAAPSIFDCGPLLASTMREFVLYCASAPAQR